MWIGQRQAGGNQCGRNSRKHSRGLTPQVGEARPLPPSGFSTKEATEGRGHFQGVEGMRVVQREREAERTPRPGMREKRKAERQREPQREARGEREREVDKIPNEDRAPEGKEPGRERDSETGGEQASRQRRTRSKESGGDDGYTTRTYCRAQGTMLNIPLINHKGKEY